LKQKREKEEDERIRALPPKEREDVRKRRERLSGRSSSFILSLLHLCLVESSVKEMWLSQIHLRQRWPDWFHSRRRSWQIGRQLFETTKIIDDEKYYEEGSTSIDISKYSREERDKERREEEEEEEKRRAGLLADEGD
jgi:hypothetical protein